MSFGTHIKALRQSKGKGYGLRPVAEEIGVHYTFLAHMEADRKLPKNPDHIIALAGVLDEDPDVLLAMAGFISPDLRERIAQRPNIFRACVQQLRTDIQTAATRTVRDGKW